MSDTAAPATPTVPLAMVPTMRTVTAELAPSGAEAVGDLKAKLARDSFSVTSNPRRRRQRRGDGSFHYDYETVDQLRQISRWQEAEASTYGGLLNVWATYIGAPTWIPGTSDPQWNKLAAAVIAADLKAKRHHVAKRLGWDQYVRLLAISIARDGQMAVAHTVYGGGQLIEAERLINLEQTSAGQVISWTIAPMHAGQIDRGNAAPFPASMVDVPQVLSRTSQTWGVPVCCSSLDDHDGIADLWQAEIDSAAESARPWMIAEEKDGANGLPGGMTIPDALGAGIASTSTVRGAGGRDSADMGWVRTPNGNIMGAPKGLKLTAHQPGRPNTDVPEFSKSMLRICCMVLLPYELAFLDQAGINMSNGRGIVRVGNTMLDKFRSTYLNAPLERQIQGLLRTAQADGRLPINPEWSLGKFEWPRIPEHDRLKERQADALDRANGTANLKDLNGEQWSPMMDQRGAELGKAAEIVEKHNAAHPTCKISIADIYGDPAHIAQLAVTLAQIDANAVAASMSLTPTSTHIQGPA